jgi:hypothetical protein
MRGKLSSSQATKGWALLGKISLVIGLLIALHTIYNWIWQSGPKLDARCSEYEFALAPDIERALEAGRSLSNEKSNTDTNFNYINWKRVALFKIRNLGDKQADQVILCLDENANGLATITYDGKTETEQVGKTLNLGLIRPSGEVSIKIWSVSSVLPSGFFFDGVATVTHSAGIVNVKNVC